MDVSKLRPSQNVIDLRGRPNFYSVEGGWETTAPPPMPWMPGVFGGSSHAPENFEDFLSLHQELIIEAESYGMSPSEIATTLVSGTLPQIVEQIRNHRRWVPR